MLHKPKMLFLSQGFPFPADGGGMIKTYNSLLTLSQKFEIYALFLSEKSPSSSELKHITSKGIRVKVFHNQNVYKSVKSNLRWLLSNFIRLKPHYQMQYEVDEAFPFIKKIIQEFNPQIIHVDHLNLSPYLPEVKQEMWTLEHHNVEFFLYWTRFVHTNKFTRKCYLFIEMVLTYLFELKWLARFDRIYAISPEDARRISTYFPIKSNRVSVQPLVYPLDWGRAPYKKNSSFCLFVGNNRWPPNEDALEWFIVRIWPRIISIIPKATFHIVGMEYKDLVDRLPHLPSVYFHGFKKNINPYLKKADVFVMPFRMGGGVRIKALTALASGLPLVSTSLGVEGLNVKNGESVLIAENEKHFAAAVANLLNSTELRNKLRIKGREYFESNHSQRLNKAYLTSYQKYFKTFLIKNRG